MSRIVGDALVAGAATNGVAEPSAPVYRWLICRKRVLTVDGLPTCDISYWNQNGWDALPDLAYEWKHRHVVVRAIQAMRQFIAASGDTCRLVLVRRRIG